MKRLTVFSVTMMLACFSASAAQSSSSKQVDSNKSDMLGAFKTDVKQLALSSNQKSTVFHNSMQQLATAIGAIDMAQRVKAAVMQFDSGTGQPNALKCPAQASVKRTVFTRAQQEEDTSKLAAFISAYPSLNALERETEILEGHKSAFCSISEHMQGMCKIVPNGMQSWDVDYSKAFGQSTVSEDGYMATYAFAKTITNFTAGADSTQCTKNNENCMSAEFNNLEPLAESSMVTAVIVDQGNSRRRPLITSKKESLK